MLSSATDTVSTDGEFTVSQITATIQDLTEIGSMT